MFNGPALVVALMLLTRLPVPARWQPAQFSPALQSRSVLFYPLVGTFIGALLASAAYLLSQFLAPLVAGALLVAAWLWLTGALHLDGLADTADALAAAHKDQSRLHLALKDPHLGAIGACTVVMVLILKVALVTSALEGGLAGPALLAAAVAARLLCLVYMVWTPYIRPDGIAGAMQLAPYRNSAGLMMALGLLVAVGAFGWFAAMALGACLLAWLLYWRRRWQRLIGGYSGDCAGALIEIAEVIVLLVLVACL